MTTQAIRRDKSTGFIVSFIFHTLLFTAGSFMFVRPAEYAVDAGSGGLEIHLTAAPAPAASDPAPEYVETAPAADPDEMRQHEIEEAAATETPNADAASAASTDKGDGSSAAPGADATTFHSAAGALTEARPHYLTNPAPAYPREAREKGWQGVVLLKVFVDKHGRPSELEMEKSSGREVLDRSALKAVRTWRFRPAQVGSLAVESTVLVPVRFEIEKRANAKRS